MLVFKCNVISLSLKVDFILPMCQHMDPGMPRTIQDQQDPKSIQRGCGEQY